MKVNHLLIFCLILLSSCKNNSETSSEPENPSEVKETKAANNPALNLAKAIETAHHQKAFQAEKAIKFHLDLNFGANTRINATVSMMTDSSKIKIEKSDSTTLYYNGNKMMLSPKDKNYKQARFDMFTWAYFFALPQKLTDPGSVLSDYKSRKLLDVKHETAQLTFHPKTGDTPKDWYILYVNPHTKLLKAAAYIITSDKTVSEAEKSPHVIVYEDYFTLGEVPIAKHWKFYNWEEDGIHGDPIGEAEISDVHFFKPEVDYFKAPQDAVKVEK